MNPLTSENGLGLGLGPRAVRALLNRHGVQESRHIKLVAELLGVEYTVAHRRMNGSVEWKLDELDQVAGHFGESLSLLFEDADSDDREDALLLSGGARVPCRVVVGLRIRNLEAAASRDPSILVATKLGSQWVVQPVDDVGAGPHFEVSRLVVSTAQRRSRGPLPRPEESGQKRANV